MTIWPILTRCVSRASIAVAVQHSNVVSIVGSGTVSNADRSTGSACIAEKRALETIAEGKPATPFLKFGDRVRIEMLDAEGSSLFGAIDQQLAKYTPSK